MDISAEQASQMYSNIYNNFNSGSPMTQDELFRMVEKRDNLFSVVASVVLEIARYDFIRGNQASSLILCILQEFLPVFKQLVILEEQGNKVELQMEVDRLTGIILKSWNESWEDGNNDERSDGSKTGEVN